MPRSSYPVIGALTPETQRPFWSVMIPTYNRTDYLERTLRTVLSQASSPDDMQIEVLDNASTSGDAEEITRRLGGGRITFFRQPQNLGMVGNWNSCIERARGYWVHILHDDDVPMPGFYATFRRFIDDNPSVGMVFSRAISIDEDDNWLHLLGMPPGQKSDGLLEDALFRLTVEDPAPYLRCPAVVVRRDAYEATGGFDASLIFTSDWQMWIRVAAQVPVGYIHHPQALYREHQSSGTNESMLRHNYVLDFERTIKDGIALLPPSRRAEARQRSQHIITRNGMYFHYQLLRAGRPDVALQYARRVFRAEPTIGHFLRLCKDVVRSQFYRAHRNAEVRDAKV
jgi:GT2 family glycosyltransferase